MSEKDGGPAFPAGESGTSDTYRAGVPGMTLRQFYKGQALAGMVPTTSERSLWLRDEAKHRGVDGYAVIAENCGRYADAMLAEDKGRDGS